MSNEFETNLLGRRARVHHKYSSGDDTVACIEGEIVGVKLDGGDIAVYIENEADGFVGYYDRRGFRLIRDSQGDTAEAKSRVADKLGEMHTRDKAIELIAYMHSAQVKKEAFSVKKACEALKPCGKGTYYAANEYARANQWIQQAEKGNTLLTAKGVQFLRERDEERTNPRANDVITLDEVIASE